MGTGAEIRPGEGLARVGLRLAALVIVAGVVGAVTCGCPAIREGRHARHPGVPTPRAASRAPPRASPPTPGWSPVQCDNTRRMYFTPAPRGRHAPHLRRGCVVRDEPDAGQTARCVGPDGGVR